jgi:lipopolysaccharide export system protein LptC
MTRGRAGGLARVLASRPAPELRAVWLTPDRSAGRARSVGDRYSRRVALLKRLLPVLGLALLVLVAAWPQLGPLLDSVGLGLPAIDLREARELRMLNPRYAGIDRLNRPYVVTSAVGRQVPDRDDLMSLEQPKAEMITHRGATVVMTAATAIYQSQTQLLDLFDDVNLIHENGTRFVTRTAHVDLSTNTAEGHDPVVGHGPSGDIAAQGFRILDKGDTIIFAGDSNLLLKGTKPSANQATPSALPADIAATAAQIEAAAASLPAADAPEPIIVTNVVPEAAPAAPAVEAAPIRSRVVIKRGAQVPEGGAPTSAKAKRDGG